MAFRLLSKRALCTSVRQASAIEKHPFGTTKCGQNVDLFKMNNSKGMTIEVINYGAHLRTVNVPDRNNKQTDVTVGLDNISDYEERSDYFGCIAGRYANRIGKGQFSLKGKQYQIGLNDGINTLHGGFEGFSKKVWTVVSEINDSDKVGVRLNYVSPDGEEGYPSECNITCEYLLYLNENTFDITYNVTTDNETIINVTNHAYWNLNGEFNDENSLCNGSHELQIHSSFITPIDNTLITTGELLYVNDTPFDFKKLYDIGARINDPNHEQLKFGGGYDHNFVINNDGYKQGDLIPDIAILKSNDNGIALNIDTDQPGIQFYSGNFLNGTRKDKFGELVQRRSACCLETQHFPDSPNKVNFPSTVITKDKPFNSITKHKFTAQ
eukprot:505637_1